MVNFLMSLSCKLKIKHTPFSETKSIRSPGKAALLRGGSQGFITGALPAGDLSLA